MSDAPSTSAQPLAGARQTAGGALGAHIIAITSGKGGVGKTFISANLAAALTRHGLKVLVLDADLGLANLDVVLNLHPKITLHDVFIGRASLEEAVIEAPGGFSVLLAGSGMVEYSRLTPEVRSEFINVVQTLAPRYDVVLNLHPKITLHDVFIGRASLEEAVIEAPGGFSVLLAGSGMVEYSRLTPEVRSEFINVVQTLAPRYDVVLLDTGAGISDVVLFSVSLAAEVLIVATPEPTSLTDAYAAIKVLATQQKRQHLRLVVNQAARAGDGRAITSQLQQVLNRFVTTETGRPVRLLHLGDIPADNAVREAVMRRQLLLQGAPGSPASLAVAQLANKIKSTVLE